MSAAIYAARKGLDVLLTAEGIGGQLAYTATIENYLGMSSIGGKEMTEQFRAHMERYPIVESLGSKVVKVKRKDKGFLVITGDDQQFTGNSLIYCAGMEYRRLGVPGEDSFIGQGISFCATCDAPLYTARKVAVVGDWQFCFHRCS